MEPIVNKQEYYLHLIKDFIIEPLDWHSPIFHKLEKDYEKLGLLRNSYLPLWDQLVEKILALKEIEEVRDSSMGAGNHMLNLNIKRFGPGQKGIVLCVSMLGMYGIYFADYTQRSTVPMEYGFVGDGWLSYYPFDKEGEELSRIVLDLVAETFPDFSKFDNSFASIKVKNVHLDHLVHELDLFTAIFSTNTIFQ